MRNILKRKMILLSILCLTIITAVGCSSNYKKSYTINENKVIDFANNQISQRYDVNIIKDELEYSVAKQVDENKFENLKENDNPKIVVVSANRVSKIKKGEVLNYLFIYDIQNKKVVDSKLEII
ncbi:MAG: hypothetical protein ACRCXA_07230 [Peptostreptococcaceae bacterium]